MTDCVTVNEVLITKTLTIGAGDGIASELVISNSSMLVWVFANGSRYLCSIPGRVIPKTKKKRYLISLCLTLSIIMYESRVKWSNPGKGVAPSPTRWCSSYWKGSLLVTFDCGRQFYLFYLLTRYDWKIKPQDRKIISFNRSIRYCLKYQ